MKSHGEPKYIPRSDTDVIYNYYFKLYLNTLEQQFQRYFNGYAYEKPGYEIKVSGKSYKHNSERLN